MTQATVVRPRGVSWIAVLSGWLASVGVTALLVPAAAALWPTSAVNPNDVMLAVPPVLGVLAAYLIGGYVSGRMAGYRTSWHGLLTAFFGAFVVLVAVLIGLAAERGLLGGLSIRAGDGFAAVMGGPVVTGDALLFGGAMGFLIALIGGWIGGLLAPTHRDVVTVAAPVVAAPAAEPDAPAAVDGTKRIDERAARLGYPMEPSGAGLKGGERHEDERAPRTD